MGTPCSLQLVFKLSHNHKSVCEKNYVYVQNQHSTQFPLKRLKFFPENVFHLQLDSLI